MCVNTCVCGGYKPCNLEKNLGLDLQNHQALNTSNLLCIGQEFTGYWILRPNELHLSYQGDCSNIWTGFIILVLKNHSESLGI